jgi:hypothetical protein
LPLISEKLEEIIMKELKDIIDQLEFVSYDDCTKELSASENAIVIVGKVQKLKGSEDSIIVSPLDGYQRKFQFKIQDIERIEKITNIVFRVFIKVDSICIVLTTGRSIKSTAGTRRRRRFDFGKMRIHSHRPGSPVCDIYCDSCVVGPPCDTSCDCYETCDCYTCHCDCDYVA